AAGWQADNGLFPPTRSGSVRVLTAARPVGGEGPSGWLDRLGWYLPGFARVFELNLFDRDGIVDVLRQMGNPLAPLAIRFDVVDALFRKSEGDPLLIGLYVNELRKHVSSPEKFEVTEFEQIEPGLAGFFRHWLEDQEKLWGNERHQRKPKVRTL